MIVFPVLIPVQNFLFPGTGRENLKCHGKGRDGKFEACIPGNHGKREFPLTPVLHLVPSKNQFTFAQNRPKSDISGALGPIHNITLKAFAMAKAFNVMLCIGPSAPLISDFGLFWANVN